MSAPQRIQRRRSKGWKMPPGAVYVGRPTKWGNPFRLALNDDGALEIRDEHGTFHGVFSCRDDAAAEAVALFRVFVTEEPGIAESIQADLRGKDLACWCRPGEACHADALLEVANRTVTTLDAAGKDGR